jgi:hypothetical protein
MGINLWKMIFVLTPDEKDICTNTCGSATEMVVLVIQVKAAVNNKERRK